MTSSAKQLTVPAHALQVGDVVVWDTGAGINQVTHRRTITKVDTKRKDDRVGVWYADGYSTSFGSSHGILIERTEKTLGEMTPAEREATVKRAVAKFQAELNLTSGEIARALTELDEEA